MRVVRRREILRSGWPLIASEGGGLECKYSKKCEGSHLVYLAPLAVRSRYSEGVAVRPWATNLPGEGSPAVMTGVDYHIRAPRPRRAFKRVVSSSHYRRIAKNIHRWMFLATFAFVHRERPLSIFSPFQR